jgi:SulP family sulfate permease
MTSPAATRLVRLFGTWVDEVTPLTLRADLLAGLLGAVLVLPQAVAFALLAGLPPQYGLATAILPCIVAALAGSSRHVMSGPTNANSLALFAMLSPLALAGGAPYIELALAVTVLVGVMQTLIGALRLGSVAHFISPAALLGFTSGAALLIALQALKDAIGLEPVAGQGTWEALGRVVQAPGLIQPSALLVTAVTIGTTLLSRRLAPRLPSMLIGLAGGTGLSLMLHAGWLPLSAVREIGPVPLPWPEPHWPRIDWKLLPELIGLSFALTLVALAQSISIAKAVAARSGQRIDANREFTGQGLSNIVGGLTSSYVSCGSLNRSLPNLEAGARTPLAAVFSALWLAGLAALSAPWLAFIPFAAIAGLLLMVAVSLLDLARWQRLRTLSGAEFAIALATLAATVTLRLDIAILLGSLLSLGAYLQRTSRPAMRSMGFDRDGHDRPFVVLDGSPGQKPECPQLKLLRMEGSIYFGAAQHVADTLHALRHGPRAPKHLLVMAKSMNFIDPSGAQVWEEEWQARRAMGGQLYFHRPRPQVLAMWERSGYVEALGRAHLFPDKRTAIARIVPTLDDAICARCTVRLFEECDRRPGADPTAMGL